MVIDTTLCIGCNACVLACQAENNVPVVGPEEVARGRDHALAADRHLRRRSARTPRPGFQPVPCMHCEQAPCEPVCPVEASVHDNEGLNVQVYNRCIGTRFCQSNCPYKVRRFNFFGYADGQDTRIWAPNRSRAQHNPEVTVRAARRDGEMHLLRPAHQRGRGATPRSENREIADGEVVTACQPACPTRAISFGDLQRPGRPRSTRLRHEPQHYALLGHLGTRPRTTYLARLRNPNPTCEDGSVMSTRAAACAAAAHAGRAGCATYARRSTRSSARRCCSAALDLAALVDRASPISLR